MKHGSKRFWLPCLLAGLFIHTNVLAQDSTGSAFGESVDLSINTIYDLATVQVKSGPLPWVAGQTPPNFVASDTLLSVDLDANLKLVANDQPATAVGILQAGTLDVNTAGDDGPSSASSALVEGVDLELLGTVLLPLVLGITADEVSSTANAAGSCASGLTAVGDAVLTSATLASDLGELAGITGSLAANPAPNTVLLDAALLGGHLRIVLNEQIETGDGVSSRGITVNAIHITLEDIPVADVVTDINGEVIIAQSVAAVTCTQADLQVTKLDDADPVLVGSVLTYTISVFNAGPDTATAVELIDTLPAGVELVGISPSQGSCQHQAGIITCQLGTLVNQAMATVQVQVIPTTAGTLVNAVSVDSEVDDPNPDNDNDTEGTAAVNPPPPVGIPTLGEWGMAILALSLLLCGLVIARRGRNGRLA